MQGTRPRGRPDIRWTQKYIEKINCRVKKRISATNLGYSSEEKLVYNGIPSGDYDRRRIYVYMPNKVVIPHSCYNQNGIVLIQI